MEKECFIVEDLLPLYNEGLLNPKSAEWVKVHLKECNECKNIAKISTEEITAEKLKASLDREEMFIKINRKISIYQIIFVALSFFFAIKTSMLNNSFEFVLWYTVLGAVTYLFYKDMKIVFFISFIPIFLWSVGGSIMDYIDGSIASGISLLEFAFEILQGAIFTSLIHYIFAAIGSFMGLLIIKIKE